MGKASRAPVSTVMVHKHIRSTQAVSKDVPSAFTSSLTVTKNSAHFKQFALRAVHRGFGGLEDACWPPVPKFAGSNTAEAVGFFGAKENPQHAFLRRGSKAGT
jgi:hypothetical protein